MAARPPRNDDPPTLVETLWAVPPEGDDAPTIAVPSPRLSPSASGKRDKDDVKTLEVPAPRLTEPVAADAKSNADDPATVSMSVAEQRALLEALAGKTLTTPTNPHNGDDAAGDDGAGDFNVTTLVGGITELHPARPSTPSPPSLPFDIQRAHTRPQEPTGPTDDEGFDTPTITSGLTDLSRAAQRPVAAEALATIPVPQPKLVERPAVDVDVTTTPERFLPKELMLRTDPSAPTVPEPPPIPPAATAWGAAPAPMPLVITEADISTTPSTHLSPAMRLALATPTTKQTQPPPPLETGDGDITLPQPLPQPRALAARASPASATAQVPGENVEKAENVAADANGDEDHTGKRPLKPLVISQQAMVIARPSEPSPTEPPPPPQPVVEPDTGDAFAESTGEAFRPAAPAASLAALAGLKRASSSSSSSSGATASPVSPLQSGESKEAPAAKEAQPEKSKSEQASPNPTDIKPVRKKPWGPPSPDLVSESSAKLKVAAVVAVVVVVAFAVTRKGKAAVDSLPAIALPLEAATCVRVWSVGKDLMCEASPASVNTLSASERSERLRVTKEVAAAAGFARVVFTEKDRVWRIVEIRDLEKPISTTPTVKP